MSSSPATGLIDRAYAVADSLDLRNGVVAIDGPTGSGKSTFADALVARLAENGRPPMLVRTDAYATWTRPAAWWRELERDVLVPHFHGHDISYRPRVWVDGRPSPGPVQWLDWAPLLVVEGVTAARRAVADRLSRALWIDGPCAEARLERSVGRDGEDQRGLLAAWQRWEDGWFAVDGTRDRCEWVVAD